METEDMLGDFDWVKRFGVGGKSGGWLLVYPGLDHANLELTIDALMDEYFSETGLLSDEEVDLIKSAELVGDNPADAELAALGLGEIPDYSNYSEMADELHTALVIENRALDNRDTDLSKMVTRINEFKSKAEEMFYEFVRGQSFNESKLPTFKQFVILDTINMRLQESLEDTWTRGKDTVTLKQLLRITKDIPVTKMLTKKLMKHVLHGDNPEEMSKIDKTHLKYPVLVLVNDDNSIKYILDGHHRIQKANKNDFKSVNVKLIKFNKLPKNFKKVLGGGKAD
jgi:hypothetical protein